MGSVPYVPQMHPLRHTREEQEGQQDLDKTGEGQAGKMEEGWRPVHESVAGGSEEYEGLS